MDTDSVSSNDVGSDYDRPEETITRIGLIASIFIGVFCIITFHIPNPFLAGCAFGALGSVVDHWLDQLKQK